MTNIAKLVTRFIKIDLTQRSMTLQVFGREAFLNRMYRKSESTRTEKVASVSLNMFEYFCKNEGKTEDEMIKEFQSLIKVGDIRNVCLVLDRFIQFLGQDQDDIILNGNILPVAFKKKSPKTIKTYFCFVKTYLRQCHDVKISNEDVKDYIQFPKVRKEQRKAISIDTLKKIFRSNASEEQKALFSCLLSSGMRIGEALQLTKENFHLDENPVRITLDAEITKTKESRETFISSESVDKLKGIMERKKDNERIFTDIDDIDKAVINVEQAFGNLRERLDLVEKYKNSCRYVVNIHSFRAYFHTKASQKHGSDYANALDGHGAYLKQYYREDPKERAKKYLELEPNLLIESYHPEAEQTKDKIISSLQDEMKKLQDKMTRLEFLNKPLPVL